MRCGLLYTKWHSLLLFSLLLFLLPLVQSCKEEPNLDELKSRIDALETELEKRKNDTIFIETIDSIGPQLLSFGFYAEDNPLQLVMDASGRIANDGQITVRVSNILPSYELRPSMCFYGDSVTIDGVRADSTDRAFDFSKVMPLVVHHGLTEKVYQVHVISYTGLPIVWIETENRAAIMSRTDYMKASFLLDADNISLSVNIRGHGNSSWDAPKKPYRLLFDENVSVLGLPTDKSWLLLANYYDKTMLRNATAFYLSSLSNLEYTPRWGFVELILNGSYSGTYQLVEKLKISQDRINLTEGGYLLEVDAKYAEGDSIFYTPHLIHPVNIKEPDNLSPEDVNYIKTFVNQADAVLFSSYYQDAENGWMKYMDIESFVDWYLVNEIAKNTDGALFSSCFMTLEHGGKLKMGPVWDFDIAFGNVDYNTNCSPTGLWMIRATWYTQLFRDPRFVEKVKERYKVFYSHKDDIMRFINANAEYLHYSVRENEKRWGVLYAYTWPNYDIWGAYQNEVQHLKEWLNTRMEWLNAEFDSM